ncbi:signal recognition particle protein [Buchnera aphidicola]|uniref:signal-recognition-particle GTPase n=1 Tax=Buchnera aphidicola (Sarucallis kahawaluokalani) TaxID=1241878 RepID=A0A4D6Y804_9GAMM|nr:signal recognition particle protein [Buchnera aphidicola]QCI26056.1 signal recognition particle protein [Buchnera aphidicola (Sarucallis kahawaluokalani)]
MFTNLAKKFISIITDISGYGRITEKKLHDMLKKIRITLLEADVALAVINKIINQIKTSIIGKNINLHLTPGQEFIKILKQELIFILSNNYNCINLPKKQLSIILIVGLQGSGKTSVVGKLGHFISLKYKKNVLVASTDIYRPAAMEQLKTIAKKANIQYYNDNHINDPLKICNNSIKKAKKSYDVLILDTAGRVHTDEYMMQEIHQIQKITNPNETLFVIDSMMGQDAINAAKTFNQYLNISGLILTKIDSDTRGGAALSAGYITKKPVKFISIGEKIKSFIIFNPEKIVSKILGMEDIITIIEDVDKKISNQKKNTLIKNKTFDLNNFKSQIQKIKNIGSINKFISNIPIKNLNYKSNKKHEKKIKCITAIIESMTPNERKNPKIIKNSRKKRISKGSGTTIQEINQLLKEFYALKKIMKKIKTNKTNNLFKYFKNILPNIF